MSFMASMFETEKPVIGMLHLQPLPGDPLYYPGGSVSRVIDAAKRDLEALQSGGVDGILITNELSMPYEQHVSAVTLAAMGHVIGALAADFSTPWGAEAIYDGDATIELCAAVEAQFTRCNFCGAWAGDLGLINRDFARTMRRRAALRLDDLKMFHFITSEGEVYLNDRSTPDIADSLVFNCLPDALLLVGLLPGAALRANLPTRCAPVLAMCRWYVERDAARIPLQTCFRIMMARLSVPASSETASSTPLPKPNGSRGSWLPPVPREGSERHAVLSWHRHRNECVQGCVNRCGVSNCGAGILST